MLVQRWKGQAREYRQKQLLDLEKPKHNGRLYVPDIARGVKTEDIGDSRVSITHVEKENSASHIFRQRLLCLSASPDMDVAALSKHNTDHTQMGMSRVTNWHLLDV